MLGMITKVDLVLFIPFFSRTTMIKQIKTFSLGYLHSKLEAGISDQLEAKLMRETYLPFHSFIWASNF